MDLWTTEQHIQTARTVLARYKFSIKIYSSHEEMPQDERIFADVHVHKRVIHILSGYNQEFFLGALWHEVGHVIAGDEQSRDSDNWSIFPKHIQYRKLSDLQRTNMLEDEACTAEARILRRVGVPEHQRVEFLSYVATDIDADLVKKDDRY